MTTQAKTSRWRLFVDESGSFEPDSSAAFLAALAFQVSADPLGLARLREILRKQVPLVPWPLHRWLLDKPAIYPFWSTLAPELKLPTDTQASLKAALELWEIYDPALSARISSNLKTGQEPSPRELQILSRTLREYKPQVLAQLKALATRNVEAVTNIFSTLFNDASRSGHAFGFFAAEADPKDAIIDESGERYFNLLVNLLSRVHEVFARLDGEHLIEINLERRDAKHPDLPETKTPTDHHKTPLTRAHISRASNEVYAQLPSRAGHLRVRFSVGGVWASDDDTHPGLVVADSLANIFYRRATRFEREISRRLGSELAHLHARIHQYTGLLAALNATPELSHFSATGRAADAVSDARAGAQPTPFQPTELSRRWAAEQANQWIDFYRARRA